MESTTLKFKLGTEQGDVMYKVDQNSLIICDAIEQKQIILVEVTKDTEITNEKNEVSIHKQSDGTSLAITSDDTELLKDFYGDIVTIFNSLDLRMADFKIISVIGRGAFGKVMLVQHIRDKKIFALKSLHKEKINFAKKSSIVVRERNILSRVHHPFIVQLKFSFQTSSKFYLGMEYIPGGELYHYMEQMNVIPIDEVKLYIAEIAIALDYLHSIGILYRDLKPENILLDEKGCIKLIDFGLAKDFSNNNGVYTTNTFCSTLDYMAPEIASGKDYSYEVDWWALAAVAFEMLTATTPFYSRNKKRMINDIINGEPKLNLIEDKDAYEWIKSMLVKEPSKRPKFEDIKNHPFFKEIDWNKVYNKEYQHKFIPSINDIMIPSNFDEEYTSELPRDSFVNDNGKYIPEFEFYNEIE